MSLHESLKSARTHVMAAIRAYKLNHRTALPDLLAAEQSINGALLELAKEPVRRTSSSANFRAVRVELESGKLPIEDVLTTEKKR